MLLICESGSTKADWALLSNTQRIDTETMGINPLFHDNEKINSILASNATLIEHASTVEQIYFYGTSCSSAERIERVRKSLQTFFLQTSFLDLLTENSQFNVTEKIFLGVNDSLFIECQV